MIHLEDPGLAIDDRDLVSVRAATVLDAESVARIYNHYIRETVVTFEEEPLSASEIARRIEEVQRASLYWLVAERDGNVIGYAYAGKWNRRSAYRFAAEVTVYIDPDHVGRGLGSRLYRQLFTLLERQGIHAVIGGIALPNEASVALHEKFGLQKVAHLKEVGFKFNRWIDVGYWQRFL
jgi:L-amino acid N-acyltransferase YncA